MRAPLGLCRAVHIVQTEHPEIDASGAEVGDPTLQETTHRIAHIEVNQPPRRTGRRQRP